MKKRRKEINIKVIRLHHHRPIAPASISLYAYSLFMKVFLIVHSCWTFLLTFAWDPNPCDMGTLYILDRTSPLSYCTLPPKVFMLILYLRFDFFLSMKIFLFRCLFAWTFLLFLFLFSNCWIGIFESGYSVGTFCLFTGWAMHFCVEPIPFSVYGDL